MPLPEGTSYRWKTYSDGAKVRLAFRNGDVIEAKSSSGKVHTPREFAADRKRKASRASIQADALRKE